MINYRLYAFILAMQEMMNPNQGEAARIYVYRDEMSADVKKDLQKEAKNGFDVFSQSIDNLKENLQSMSHQTVWDSIDPIQTLELKIDKEDEELKRLQEKIKGTPLNYFKAKNKLFKSRDKIKYEKDKNIKKMGVWINSPFCRNIEQIMADYQRHVEKTCQNPKNLPKHPLWKNDGHSHCPILLN